MKIKQEKTQVRNEVSDKKQIERKLNKVRRMGKETENSVVHAGSEWPPERASCLGLGGKK